MKGVSVAASPTKAPKFGVPTGKFLELSQKTNKRQPYEVTDKLSVQPWTKKRREQMRDAERRMAVGQGQLNIAYALSRVPVPPVPVQDIVDPEDTAAAAAAAGRYKDDLAVWKREVELWRENLTTAQTTIDEKTAAVRQAETDHERAFFGADVYDQIAEFFDEQDESLYDDFIEDVKRHFIPSQPDDGSCPSCGHIEDEDAAGKDTKPSTG